MKKFFGAVALSAILVACGNDGASTGDLQDSVMETIDSAAGARKDSIDETTDSVKSRLEDTFEKTDSANANAATTDSTAAAQ
jgi:hypothetical protein